MASIIPGYEFDIFVSYRHKDDKYDHWVREFIKNLKLELEATFREQLTIYYDNNPADGLLETDDVDASLRGKLKCLVFIPVLSHTYCDQFSFAWANEFRTFIQQASADKYGLKIKLPNGNFASRVLPVIIHDLSEDEKILCERILGSQLRGIEFIYREPGVNRPLRTIEDDPHANLNHTSYRNQINKVANSVKAIISSMMMNEMSVEAPDEKDNEKVTTGKMRQGYMKKILLLALFLLLFLSGSVFAIKYLKTRFSSEKSIAVLPFVDDSPGDASLLMTNGLMDELILSLQSIKELRVISRNSVEQYRHGNRPSTPEISRSLKVNYLIEGRAQKSGNSLQVRIDLVKASRKERSIWGKSFQLRLNEVDDIFAQQSQIAQSIAHELKVAITPAEKNLIEKTNVPDPEAFGLYQAARDQVIKYELDQDILNTEPLNKAEAYFRKTLQVDPEFSKAYSGLAICYIFKDLTFSLNTSIKSADSLNTLIQKSLAYDQNNPEAFLARAWYYIFLGNSEKASAEANRALELNPNYWEAFLFKGEFLYRFDFRKNNFVRALDNIKSAMSLNGGSNLSNFYIQLGVTLGGFGGFHREAGLLYKKAFLINNDSGLYYLNLTYNALDNKNIEGALKYNKLALRYGTPRIDAMQRLSQLYMYIGKNDSAIVWFKRIINQFEQTGNIQRGILHRIAYSYARTGDTEKANYWFTKAIESNENSIKNQDWDAKYAYTSYYDLAGIYAFLGDREKAYENLDMVRHIEIVPEWWLTLIEIDPLFESIRTEDRFRQIVTEFEAKFREEHDRVSKWAEENKELLE